MKKICYIVGASDTAGMFFDKREGDYVIAADAGFDALINIGIMPDLVVGDFDSLGRLPVHDNIIRHPVEKDETDTALAICEGMKRGYRTFVIYGGLGGRLDHTVANLQTCAGAAEHEAECWIWGEGNAVCTMCDGCVVFEAGKMGRISIFAVDRASGVTLKGLKYPLDNAVLTSTMPLGVSNEFTGKTAKISVADGTLIITWTEDAEPFVERVRSSV